MAVGPDEVRRFYRETPAENRQGVMIQHPCRRKRGTSWD